jgi:hypothetical protein
LKPLLFFLLFGPHRFLAPESGFSLARFSIPLDKLQFIFTEVSLFVMQPRHT